MKLKTKIGLWTVACLTGFVGIIDFLSAVTPGIPERVELIRQIYPFEVRAGSHIFAAVSGFILLTLASRLLRRKRVAWLLAIILLAISIVSHLLKGLDVEETIPAAILLILLLLLRQQFTARSDRPSIAQGVRVLIGALVFTLAYGTAGFFLMKEQYTTQFDLPAAIVQTLAIFFTVDNAGLEPATRFGRFFISSIYIVGASTLSYACWMLLRPVLLRTTATDEELQQAQKIVEQYGSSSLARFCLLPDKSYYFSSTEKSVIAYVAKGKGAIALGDPIGATENIKDAVIDYQEFCASNDWYPAFYQTLPDYLDIYKAVGFKTLKIGEEAIVDLNTFTTQGKAGKNLRLALNKFSKLGYQVKFYQPPISDELLTELKTISDEWLNMMEGSEKRFSLGWFDRDYLRESEIATVETDTGKINAFANVVPEYQKNEITIDLMRRRAEIERATMDFLFISMFLHFKERGYEAFNLGLSALSGVNGSDNFRKEDKKKLSIR
ncbi:phosphatidylglycerol lysyltransferase domain-containing protein [Myxosarcina sp. GI1]|uniref:phosphatidylglycerol lysyltransferase domain-containing protein n=1 Tax=Myxosarcina sp. GI1 TaxID=1541065 RepID=UPI00068D4A75|nr:phosphatidylglycerol lysyltransferase domain-containing protein [Myxosarcina sp. GI1]